MSVKAIVRTCASIRVRAGARTSASASIIEIVLFKCLRPLYGKEITLKKLWFNDFLLSSINTNKIIQIFGGD